MKEIVSSSYQDITENLEESSLLGCKKSRSIILKNIILQSYSFSYWMKLLGVSVKGIPNIIRSVTEVNGKCGTMILCV